MIRSEDGEGDEAGKPEEHRQDLDGQQGEAMCELRQVERRQGQIGQGEEGPDRLFTPDVRSSACVTLSRHHRIAPSGESTNRKQHEADLAWIILIIVRD